MTETKKTSLQSLPFDLFIQINGYCDDLKLFKALNPKIPEKSLDSITLIIVNHLFNNDESPQNNLKHPLFFQSIKLLKSNNIENLNDVVVNMMIRTWKKIFILPPVFTSVYEIQNMFFKANIHDGKDLLSAIGTIHTSKKEKARRRLLSQPNLFIYEDAIFKDDANIALSGFCRDETRLQHVSSRLQNCPNFIKKCLIHSISSICYVNQNLKNDPEILALLQDNCDNNNR